MMGLLVDLGKGLAALSIVGFLVAQVLDALPATSVTYLNKTKLANALDKILDWAIIVVPLVVVIGLGQWIGIFGQRR